MGPLYSFLTWVAAQGVRHIPKRLLIQAFNSFKGKLPGKEVILKTAKNLWDDVIKKTSTKDLAKQIRDKPIIPKQFNKFEPKIVKPKQLDKNFIRISKDQIDDIERSITNKPNPLGDALKTGKYTKVPTPKHLTPKTKIKDLQIGPHIDSRGRMWPKFVKPVPKGPAKIIPFPKKPPGKADGGSIDKALSGRSRDI